MCVLQPTLSLKHAVLLLTLPSPPDGPLSEEKVEEIKRALVGDRVYRPVIGALTGDRRERSIKLLPVVARAEELELEKMSSFLADAFRSVAGKLDDKDLHQVRRRAGRQVDG